MNGDPNRMLPAAQSSATPALSDAKAPADQALPSATPASIGSGASASIASLQSLGGNAAANAARDDKEAKDSKHAGAPALAPDGPEPDRNAPDRSRHMATLGRLPGADAFARRPAMGLGSRLLSTVVGSIVTNGGHIVSAVLGIDANPEGLQVALPNVFIKTLRLPPRVVSGAAISGAVIESVVLNIGGADRSALQTIKDVAGFSRSVVSVSLGTIRMPRVVLRQGTKETVLAIEARAIRALGTVDVVKNFIEELTALAAMVSGTWDAAAEQKLIAALAGGEAAFAVGSLDVDVVALDKADSSRAKGHVSVSDVAVSSVDQKDGAPRSQRLAIGGVQGSGTAFKGPQYAQHGKGAAEMKGLEVFQRGSEVDASLGGVSVDQVNAKDGDTKEASIGHAALGPTQARLGVGRDGVDAKLSGASVSADAVAVRAPGQHLSLDSARLDPSQADVGVGRDGRIAGEGTLGALDAHGITGAHGGVGASVAHARLGATHVEGAHAPAGAPPRAPLSLGGPAPEAGALSMPSSGGARPAASARTEGAVTNNGLTLDGVDVRSAAGHAEVKHANVGRTHVEGMRSAEGLVGMVDQAGASVSGVRGEGAIAGRLDRLDVGATHAVGLQTPLPGGARTQGAVTHAGSSLHGLDARHGGAHVEAKQASIGATSAHGRDVLGAHSGALALGELGAEQVHVDDGKGMRADVGSLGVAPSNASLAHSGEDLDVRARLGTVLAQDVKARRGGDGLDLQEATLGSTAASLRKGDHMTGRAALDVGMLDARNVRAATAAGGAQASHLRMGGARVDASSTAEGVSGAAAVGSLEAGGVTAQSAAGRLDVGSARLGGLAASVAASDKNKDAKAHVGSVDVRNLHARGADLDARVGQLHADGLDAAARGQPGSAGPSGGARQPTGGNGVVDARLGAVSADELSVNRPDTSIELGHGDLAASTAHADTVRGQLAGRADLGRVGLEGLDASIGHDHVEADSASVTGMGASLDRKGEVTAHSGDLEAKGVKARHHTSGMQTETPGPTHVERHIKADAVDAADLKLDRSEGGRARRDVHHATLGSAGATGLHADLDERQRASSDVESQRFDVGKAGVGTSSATLGGLDRGRPDLANVHLGAANAQSVKGLPVTIVGLDLDISQGGNGSITVQVDLPKLGLVKAVIAVKGGEVEFGSAKVFSDSKLVKIAWAALDSRIVGYIKTKVGQADLKVSASDLKDDRVLVGPAGSPTGMRLDAFIRHQVRQRMQGRVVGARPENIEEQVDLKAATVTAQSATVRANVGALSLPNGPLGGLVGAQRPTVESVRAPKLGMTDMKVDQEIRRQGLVRPLPELESRMPQAMPQSASGSGGAPVGAELGGRQWPAFQPAPTNRFEPPGASVDASRRAAGGALDHIPAPDQPGRPDAPAAAPPLKTPSGAGFMPPGPAPKDPKGAAKAAGSGGSGGLGNAPRPPRPGYLAGLRQGQSQCASYAVHNAMGMMQPPDQQRAALDDQAAASNLEATRHGDEDYGAVMRLRATAGEQRNMAVVASNLLVVDNVKRIEGLLAEAARVDPVRRARLFQDYGAGHQAAFDFAQGFVPRIGIVINDASAGSIAGSDGRGNHWVAVRLDRAGQAITHTYMDSLGDGADYAPLFASLIASFQRLATIAPAHGDNKHDDRKHSGATNASALSGGSGGGGLPPAPTTAAAASK